MRISLYIPKGKKHIGTLIQKEIALTKNIQDRKYGSSVAIGLNKILANLSDGKVFFYDTEEEEYAEIDYTGKDFIYRIDKDFITTPIDKLSKKNRYLLVLMDANECTIGELNGKKITCIWNKKSYVPRKHDAGGQSQVRFMENRRLALLHWEKEIAEQIKDIIYNHK